MAQLKHQRNPKAEFEVLANAIKLRDELLRFMLRDFGLKSRPRTPRYYYKQLHMSEEDKQLVDETFKKYGVNSIDDVFPSWYVDDIRRQVFDTLNELILTIQYANVYPTTVRECNDRRSYQNRAISLAMHLYQIFDSCCSVFDLNLNKFTPYLELINKEIALLKAWRKSDNKRLKAIKQKNRKQFESTVSECITKAAKEGKVVLNNNLAKELVDALSTITVDTYSA